MPAIRIALAAALLAACGSSRPADSAASQPQTEPADAGVSLGRPSQPGNDGGPPGLPPTVVKGSVLEAQRLTGNANIEPDLTDRAQLEGKKVMVAVKLCVDGAGKVFSVTLLKSSGVPNYDQKVLREMKSWTYRPIVSEGQPVDVCAPVTLLMTPGQPAAPPAP